MARGLDEAGREYISNLVERKEDWNYVVKEINRLVKRSDWSYDKNLDLVRWLKRKGWEVTSEILWDHISG